MAMTKSRQAASKEERINEWDLLTREIGIADFDAFMDNQERVIRRAATAYRDGYGPSKVCSYDQATHSMLLTQLGVSAGFTSLLRSAVVALSARIAQLERELKSTKRLQTKSFDDLQVEQIDDRRVRLALGKGEHEASFELKFPQMIDRGAWSERASYDRGDAVTSGGGFWVAQVDNPIGKPGTADSGWRLAVKSARGSEQRR